MTDLPPAAESRRQHTCSAVLRRSHRCSPSLSKLWVGFKAVLVAAAIFNLAKPVGAKSLPRQTKELMQAIQPTQCHTLQPENMNIEDKLVLAPIVFQGKALMSFGQLSGWVGDSHVLLDES